MATGVDIETAWAAGLFEGEGCVSINKRHNGQPVLALASTDEDVVMRFYTLVGCGYVADKGSYYIKNGHKRQWRWSTKSHAEVKKVIAMFRPYMGKRRGAKMDEVMVLFAEKPRLRREACSKAALAARKKTHCPQGHPYDAENTLTYRNGWRRCRTCHATRERERHAARRTSA